MKSLVYLFIATLIVTGTAMANTQSTDNHRAELATQKLVHSLSSSNEGVRSSALVNLTQIKVRYPEYDMSKAAKKVSQIANKDESPVIRVNASIAKSILSNELPVKTVKVKTLEPKEYFGDIYINMATPQ